ncbi:MAG: hypothetical protein L0Z62_16600, partial [Gemmataceae bacterium]|nr:hypothetical protein [Gemmataceae bacterium]
MNATHTKRFRPSFERLESRDLLAGSLTASLSDGLLRIEGTEAPDNITVRQSNDQIRVEGLAINVGGNSQPSVSATQVNRVEIHALGGHDIIRVGESLNRLSPVVTMWGGPDSNTFYLNGSANGIDPGVRGISTAYLTHSGALVGLSGNQILRAVTPAFDNWEVIGREVADMLMTPSGVLIARRTHNTLERATAPWYNDLQPLPTTTRFVDMLVTPSGVFIARSDSNNLHRAIAPNYDNFEVIGTKVVDLLVTPSGMLIARRTDNHLHRATAPWYNDMQPLPTTTNFVDMLVTPSGVFIGRSDSNNLHRAIAPHAMPKRALLRQPNGPASPFAPASTFASGTMTSSRTISPVTDARRENFPSIVGVVKPFMLRSTRKPRMMS